MDKHKHSINDERGKKRRIPVGRPLIFVAAAAIALASIAHEPANDPLAGGGGGGGSTGNSVIVD